MGRKKRKASKSNRSYFDMAEGFSMAMDENLADQVQRQGTEISNLTNQVDLLQQQNQKILALLQALQPKEENPPGGTLDRGKGKAVEDVKLESSAVPAGGPATGGPAPGGSPAGGPNNAEGDSGPPKEIWAFTNPAIKEMSKSVYSFPEAHKLRGAQNYQEWRHALVIQFTAVGLADFLINPMLANSVSAADQATILLLLKNSCSAETIHTITWETSPVNALKALQDSYSLTPEIQRDALYREFHALDFSKYKGSISEFNSQFTSLLIRLRNCSVEISAIDIKNQYLKALEGSFPQWAERLRSTIRSAIALGQSTEGINLQYLMADLLAETNNPISTAAKQAASHRAQRQNKKPKDSAEGAKEKNKAGKKGKNSDPKDKAAGQKGEPSEDKPKEKDFKGKKSKGKKEKDGNESPDNKKGGKSTAFVAVNYDLITGSTTESATEQISGTNYAKDSGIVDLDALDLSNSSESDSESGSDSDANTVDITHCKCCDHAKSNTRDSKYKGMSPVLYDTGSTDHIFNSMESFTAFSKNCNVVIRTGGGLVYPLGVGTVKLPVRCSEKPGDFEEITLKEALYIPSFDVNIISGLRHYRAGGALYNQKLFNAERHCWGILNVKDHGFFLQCKGYAYPTVRHRQNRYCSFYGLAQRITIDLKNTPPADREKYVRFDTDSEENTDSSDEQPLKEPPKGKAILNRKKKAVINSDMPKLSAESPEDSRVVEPCELGRPLGKSPEKPIPEDITLPKRGTSHARDPLPESPPVGKVQAAPFINITPKSLQKSADGWVSAEGDVIKGCDEETALKALLWHRRLGHIGLTLLKKTAKITDGLPNFDKIQGLQCVICAKTTAVRRTGKGPLPSPGNVLDSIEGDTVVLSPTPHNKKPVILLLVDRKSRFRWVFQLPNKQGPTVMAAIKSFFRALKATYGRTLLVFSSTGVKKSIRR
ncbi:hypothetical protein MAPG_01913 [Magnaporthiopsis poae ATCC 64411]|uniref:Uncharacterized protein n=1 Tax=Magnaporthiopsis poae (strain ATCC 64411 / 73-15) TaxID=644358 RepID=A0A0C4DPY2_MAGP6|nr:hypothetical protein MAPG_01913 [Magnaporthiopsis poae ATCC 64411]